METLLVACNLKEILVLPATIMSDQWIDPRPPWAAPDYALFASYMLHVAVYISYVWQISRVGSLFASQGSYKVTMFEVIWSTTPLGERPIIWFWGALLIMLLGMFWLHHGVKM